MKKKKSIQDIIIVVALMALCSYVFVFAQSFKGEAGMFPRIIAVITFFLSALQLCVSVKAYSAAAKERESSPPIAKKGMGGLELACGLLIAYVALIFLIGYYPATFIYMIGSIYLLGFRKKLISFTISAGMMAFVYALFSVLLRLNLPTGLFY